MPRFGIALVVTLGAACTKEDDIDDSKGTDMGSGSSGDGGYAPWEMGDYASVLWATDPDNDRRDGDAVLLLSEEPTDCEAMTSIESEWQMWEMVGNGDGLLFYFSYWNDSGDAEWDGLWFGGYGMSVDGESERSMGSMAFHDGYIYVLSYYGGGAWVRIDSMVGDAPSGEYSAVHWSGAFEAENCGDWQKYGYETGDWGDDTAR